MCLLIISYVNFISEIKFIYLYNVIWFIIIVYFSCFEIILDNVYKILIIFLVYNKRYLIKGYYYYFFYLFVFWMDWCLSDLYNNVCSSF